MFTKSILLALLATLMAIAVNAAEVLVIEGTLYNSTTCGQKKVYAFPQHVDGVCRTLSGGKSIKASCYGGKPATVNYNTTDCSGAPLATNELDTCTVQDDYSVSYSCQFYSDEYLVDYGACNPSPTFNLMMATDRCRPNAAFKTGYRAVLTDSNTLEFSYYLNDLTCSGTPSRSHEMTLGTCNTNSLFEASIEGVTLKKTPEDYTPAQSATIVRGTLYNSTTCGENRVYSYPDYVVDTCKTLSGGKSIKATCNGGKPVTVNYNTTDCSGAPLATNELDVCLVQENYSRSYSCQLYPAKYLVDYGACNPSPTFNLMMATDRCRPNLALKTGYRAVLTDSNTLEFSYYLNDLTCSGTPSRSHEMTLGTCNTNSLFEASIEGVTLENAPAAADNYGGIDRLNNGGGDDNNGGDDDNNGGENPQGAAFGLTSSSFNMACALFVALVSMLAPLF